MKNKNKKIIVYVCLLILCISIGYAALSTTLNITGESSIKSAKWDIHFDNLVVDSASVSATSPATINQSKNTIDYTVKLPNPGDSYSFTVEVVNAGTIDAMVSVVSNTGLSYEQMKYVSYSVTYSNGLNVNTKDALKAGERLKLKITVRYRTELSASDLPSEDETLDLTFKVTYVQADDSKNEVATGPIMKAFFRLGNPSQITKIVTKNKLEVPQNAVEKMDVSQNEDGSIMAYTESDGNGGYILTICSNQKIYLNPNTAPIFYQYSAATSMDLSNLDTSLVTSMRDFFRECGSLTSLDLSNFNTSKVTDMYDMFGGCTSLTNLNISSFDTSKVTDMTAMFSYCRSLTKLDVSSFNTSRVTSMYAMFTGCSGLTSLDVSNFKTESLTNSTTMFSGCTNLTNINLNNATFDKVTASDEMFYSCPNLTKIVVKDAAAKNFISGKVSGVDVSIA